MEKSAKVRKFLFIFLPIFMGVVLWCGTIYVFMCNQVCANLTDIMHFEQSRDSFPGFQERVKDSYRFISNFVELEPIYSDDKDTVYPPVTFISMNDINPPLEDTEITIGEYTIPKKELPMSESTIQKIYENCRVEIIEYFPLKMQVTSTSLYPSQETIYGTFEQGKEEIVIYKWSKKRFKYE